MARRGRPQPEEENPEEEVTEGIEPQEEEASPAGAEFVPEASHKPKSDVYSVMLILTFLVFLAGTIIAGREAWEHYDVQFYMFTKEGKGGAQAQPQGQPVSNPQ
jgi:hypothetical protein